MRLGHGWAGRPPNGALRRDGTGVRDQAAARAVCQAWVRANLHRAKWRSAGTRASKAGLGAGRLTGRTATTVGVCGLAADGLEIHVYVCEVLLLCLYFGGFLVSQDPKRLGTSM